MIQKKNYETRRPKEKEMVFGLRAVIEALDAGKMFDKILVRRDMNSAIGRELIDKLSAYNQTTAVQRVPVEKLNQFTDKNHQGVSVMAGYSGSQKDINAAGKLSGKRTLFGIGQKNAFIKK